MLKNLTYCGFMLVAGGVFGQGRPVLGLRPYGSPALLTHSWVVPSKSVVKPGHLPGSRSLFETRYPLTQPLREAPLVSIEALPNRLLYCRQASSLATGAALAGAVASWLLGADPRVQAYQQNWQFMGRYDAFSTPRLASPGDLAR